MKLKIVSDEPTVTIMLDGEPFECIAGQSLASALLFAGIYQFGLHPVDGSPRGPLCMIGVCQACLVEVDGCARQACCLTVSSGQNVVLPRISNNVG